MTAHARSRERANEREREIAKSTGSAECGEYHRPSIALKEQHKPPALKATEGTIALLRWRIP